jgi:hypothetical protein
VLYDMAVEVTREVGGDASVTRAELRAVQPWLVRPP